MKRLGIVRRLVGCFYCGWPCRGDVCRYCSDLPLKDPLIARARVPLSEAETDRSREACRLIRATPPKHPQRKEQHP